jgi:hypothetical protein
MSSFVKPIEFQDLSTRRKNKRLINERRNLSSGQWLHETAREMVERVVDRAKWQPTTQNTHNHHPKRRAASQLVVKACNVERERGRENIRSNKTQNTPLGAYT